MRRYSWLLVIVPLILGGCLGGKGVLRPDPPEATAGLDSLISGQPQLVTFSELQADPYAFRDRFIRVSGVYTLLPEPGCFPNSGPETSWALISEELRLDGLGFASVAQRIPMGVTLTVDGIFRLYEGPAGCGKRPAAENIWFLEAVQIVQPNPLVLVDGVVADSLFNLPSAPDQPGQTGPGASGGENPAVVPTAGGYPPPFMTVTGTAVATGTATVISTASATPTITASPAAGTTTITPTPTVTPAATASTGGGPATGTPAGTPTEPATPLPLPTPTDSGGGGYPGPPTPSPVPSTTATAYP